MPGRVEIDKQLDGVDLDLESRYVEIGTLLLTGDVYSFVTGTSRFCSGYGMD